MSRYELSGRPAPDPGDGAAPVDLLTNLDELDPAPRLAPSSPMLAPSDPTPAFEPSELDTIPDAPAAPIRYRIPLPPKRAPTTTGSLGASWVEQPKTEAAPPPAAAEPVSQPLTDGVTPRAPRMYPLDSPSGSKYGDFSGGNASGLGAGMPPEVAARRWNWGAFFLPPFWGPANGALGLGVAYSAAGAFFLLSPLLFGPVYGAPVFFGSALAMLGIGMYLGASGYEIAWRNRKQDDTQRFQQTQQGWMLSAVTIALPIYAFLFAAFGFQVIRASRENQETAARSRAIQDAAPSMATPTAPPSPPTTPSIIETPAVGDFNRDHYAHPENRPSAPSAPNEGLSGAPNAPAAGTPQAEPGALPAPGPGIPNTPDTQQPISLPSGQYEQPASSPDQNAAPPAPSPEPAPYPSTPEQNAAPPQEQVQPADPGLPPGQP
ncbi:MAG: hypothetical protein ABIY70_09520 [Capsulimonas sp.]|uniref:hypothetical protein n=1 Tax=Capsulimonas sp. TaxID=2494211 RepID=UPI00326516A5